MNQVKRKICPLCKQPFSCGNISEKEICWCNDFPPIFSLENAVDCLCSYCLKQEAIKKIDWYIESKNEENDTIKFDLPKQEKLIEDIDFYFENDNLVYTKWYLLKKGSCCETNCKHCPYK